MRAAMVGGGAYAAGKHAQRKQAPAAPAPVAAAPAAVDVAGQLTQLKGLLDAGVLTQDEFDAQKRRLLGA